MKEKYAQIGKTGFLLVSGMRVAVLVKDYRFAYGNDRWLVSPLNGTGERWVENIIFVDSDKKNVS